LSTVISGESPESPGAKKMKRLLKPFTFLARKTAFSLGRFLTRTRRVGPAALFLESQIRPLRGAGPPQADEGFNLLLLPKPGFTEDALSSFGGRPDFSLYTFDRGLIKAMAGAFPSLVLDDNKYLSNDPQVEREKSDLRDFWRRVFTAYLKRRRLDAVLTGSYWYAAEQELAGALSEIGVPFIALHKECLKTPGLETFYGEVYRTRKNKFQGTKILVYNEMERNIQIAAGVAPPADILVTGMPRLDRLHELRRRSGPGPDGPQKDNGPAPPTVLFFLFHHKSGLPVVGSKEVKGFEALEAQLERLNLARMADSAHQALLDLARGHPEMRLILKTKGDAIAKRTLDHYFGGQGPLPDNLETHNGGDLFPLIKRSAVAVGFNTTALFEALAAGLRVIVPNYYEALSPDLKPYLLDFGDAVHYADSPGQLQEMMLRFARPQEAEGETAAKQAALDNLMDQWLGNPDGRAGERVREAVIGIIQEHRPVRERR
ncbi:MAG: hypothetical protein AB1896_21760, partial [Thermodesulfobacteriota bacterium]